MDGGGVLTGNFFKSSSLLSWEFEIRLSSNIVFSLLDNEGKRIEAHGGYLYYEDGTYYWYGENKDHTSKKGKIWTWGVKIYSSKDLVNWKLEGFLVGPELNDKKSIFYPTRRLDRPHLMKNDKTGRYVLWLKYNDDASYAILTSDKLLGPYKLIRSEYHPFGYRCGDFDLEKDETTGKGYLYFETNHDSVCVAELNEDYTECSIKYSKIYDHLYPPFAREGLCHFMKDSKHYLLSSGMSGYVPNPCKIAVAEDRFGPYQDLGNPHQNDESYASFNSQPTCIFHLKENDSYIVMADRWVPDCVMNKEKYDAMVRVVASRKDKSLKPKFKDFIFLMKLPLMESADTSKSNYVWLPLEWENGQAKIYWKDSWEPLK